MLALNLVVTINNVMRIAVRPIFQGDVQYIIPILLGFAIYTLLITDYRWVSRYPIVIPVGAGFDLGMSNSIKPNIVDATISTITAPSGGDFMAWINFLFIAVGLICSVMYFLLTCEHIGALRAPTRIGRFFIMIGLGAYFGNTVLFRFTMLTGRAQFFLQVLKIIPIQRIENLFPLFFKKAQLTLDLSPLSTCIFPIDVNSHEPQKILIGNASCSYI